MMVIDNKYTFGDVVYLATDQEQYPRIVTRIVITPVGVSYELSCGAFASCHYELEIASEKNLLLSSI